MRLLTVTLNTYTIVLGRKNKITVVHRKLGKHKADGLAWEETKTIEIDERLNGFAYLETVIHEVMHIQNPAWSERKVVIHSKEMARVLWSQGFRWVDIK